VVIEPVAAAVEGADLAQPGQFRRFYAEALPRVYGYFYYRLGADEALAEDLTQETFLAAIGEIRRGIAVATPLSWILGIARHKLLDHLRRQRRAGWTLLSWESEVDEETLLVSDDNLAARDLAVAILARLPSPQREALVLRYLDGLAVAEVALLLGRSVEATESLLVRGRASFRRGYREDGHDA
jgi:RNA polymerase sigma-70 factor (ECF subfamily)